MTQQTNAYRAFTVNGKSKLAVALAAFSADATPFVDGVSAFPQISDATREAYQNALAYLSHEVQVDKFKNLSNGDFFSPLGTEDRSVYMKVGKSVGLRILANPATAKVRRLEKVVFADRQEVFAVGALITLAPITEHILPTTGSMPMDHENDLRLAEAAATRKVQKDAKAKAASKKAVRKDKKVAEQHAKVEEAIAKDRNKVDKKVQDLMAGHIKKVDQLRKNVKPKAKKAPKSAKKSTVPAYPTHLRGVMP